MVGPLGDRIRGAARSLSEFAGTEKDLTGYQEWDQNVDGAMKVLVPADQIILVTAVGVSR
jgi:hypothetical protein